MPAETHVEQGPISRQEVFEIVRDRLADILEIDPGVINEGDSFADDLDADSLALIELVEALEEELGERTVGFRIDDEDLEDLKTVRDAVDYVYGRLSESFSCFLEEIDGSFVERLGHVFADGELLVRALTHRSYVAEHPGTRSNERLEFLGDAILGLVVSEEVFSRFTDEQEGHLSRARADVVCAPALAEMALEIDLGSVLFLGKGEDASGGRERPSILADAMEAVIGAVYLDGGYEPAKRLVLKLVDERLLDAGEQDYKSRLHELAAREHDGDVGFVVTEHGPEHDKSFKAIAVIDGTALGTGEGRSKKQAEQAAAEAALAVLSAPATDPTAEPDGSALPTESNDA